MPGLPYYPMRPLYVLGEIKRNLELILQLPVISSPPTCRISISEIRPLRRTKSSVISEPMSQNSSRPSFVLVFIPRGCDKAREEKCPHFVARLFITRLSSGRWRVWRIRVQIRFQPVAVEPCGVGDITLRIYRIT